MEIFMKRRVILTLLFSVFLGCHTLSPSFAWVWSAGDDGLSSLREELDREIASYRQRVGTGISLRERIITLDRLIGNYKPLGLNVGDLEAEQSRLIIQEKQEQLRSAQAQSEATLLYEKAVAEYRDGEFQMALDTYREAERLIPNDDSIKEGRRKLEGIAPIIDTEKKNSLDGQLIRLAVTRYMENDPRRALNALIYAAEKNIDRPEIMRLRRLIETNHPEIELPRIASGVNFIDHKLQLTLEAIYEGRYLSAISECSDALDLEPMNVLAMTRLGSAYFAMNEKDKARQIWTKALQLDPNNKELKKFLYSQPRTANNAN